MVSNGMNLEEYRKRIDEALERYLPEESEYPSIIHKAMRYSVFSGGKRIRPTLVLLACQVCGGNIEDALPIACSIELIHTYSLIHDDLPSMDDDDERRGKPACHKQFGEAIAILAGDGLQSLAFQVMAEDGRVEIIREVARAIGTRGMVGGQVIDLKFSNPHKLFYSQDADIAPRSAAKQSRLGARDTLKFEKISGTLVPGILRIPRGNQIGSPERSELVATLQYANVHKTGALIAASVIAGAMVAGAPERGREQLRRFGEYIGLSFQLVDDIQDSAGYALQFGEEKAFQEARGLTNKAIAELKDFAGSAEPLRKIAEYLIIRKD